jgi:hypothetical protein
LADNDSPYAARETLEFAAALALVPCFTPVRSPESNGVSEAFVKTLKRDYARIQPVRMPSPFSNNSQPGSTTTTKITHIAVCVCAHLMSSSAVKPNQPRVRFNGGNSREIKQTPLTATVDLAGYHAGNRTRLILCSGMSSYQDAVGLCGHRIDDQPGGRYRLK